MKEFKTESKRILDLVINSIYTNKKIFLRELISNASDAIDKLKFKSLTDNTIDNNFEILISQDRTNRTLTIEDNGIGMSAEELENNLGTIAESGTFKFKNEHSHNIEENLIGKFGVGFYSAFMVAKKICVYSKKYNLNDANVWISEGEEGYIIEKTEKENIGTKIVLYLKDDSDDFKYSDFLEEYEIKHLIKQYSDYIKYPIKMLVTHTKKKENTDNDKPEYEDIQEIETLNSMLPIWKQNKKDVTVDMLNEFYKNEFYDYEAPLKSIYSKVEGTVTYNTVLFIPAHLPYNYYSNEYKRGIKLYSDNVLIDNNCKDLIQPYFGFIKGVVDTSDLNLNISREMLQQDKQLQLIANGIENKIISELKNMIVNDNDLYIKIFEEHGISIKYGIYNNFGKNNDKLKDLLMFYSSNKNKLITLSEYIKSMKENQEFIYYIYGESIEKIEQLPQIAKVKQNGYEILYLKDNIDEFVIKMLMQYDNKKFKSITDVDFDISNEEDKKIIQQKNEDYKDIIAYIKDKLKDQVQDVKLSNKLIDYPVCLTSKGELSIGMEKVINSMPKTNNMSAEKVLEINFEHPIMNKLKNLYETDKDKLDKHIVILYEIARLLEGLNISNLKTFVNNISDTLL